MYNKPKTEQELVAMRQSGEMLATVLNLLVRQTEPGITGRDLAHLAATELTALGGEPAFLGVPSGDSGTPFPDVVCISINEQVQHGIPSQRVIEEGDIVNFDFGVKYQGMITDAGLTIAVGQVSLQTQHLLDNTRRALYAGIAEVKAGVTVRQISAAIEKVLRAASLGIVRELVGHGVGHALHEDPEIPNCALDASDYILKENQTIAIEPIATLGTGEIDLTDDHWTLVSKDLAWAAHFEHTLRVTKDGCEILTQLSG